MEKKFSHRAVAPIIAHLLLVAIAVVGGILIFVFIQDFFEDTQVVSPTIEQLQFWGYNATDTDTNTLGTHAGIDVTVDSAQNNRLIDDEEFFIFIRNVGGNEILIAEVMVFGVPFTADTDSATTGNLDAAPQEWLLSTDGEKPCECQVIQPGQEATIAISWEEDVNGQIEVGDQIFVNITTGGGYIFSTEITNGLDSG